MCYNDEVGGREKKGSGETTTMLGGHDDVMIMTNAQGEPISDGGRGRTSTTYQRDRHDIVEAVPLEVRGGW